MGSIERERFEVGGADAGAWRLTGRSGIELRVAALGGAILSLRVPDRSGRLDDVVLGYDRPDSYARYPSYLGVLVGRFANRIAGARYTIDGHEHPLEANDGPNHLHGGGAGFSHAVWRAGPLEADGDPGLALEHTSPNGASGHPGTLEARVTYVVTGDSRVVVDYAATTDAATHVNVTQHSYFNLAGHGAGDVLGHEMGIVADRYLPVGDGLIPTGELREVAGTPFDFRSPVALGARIHADDEQLRRARGYDHCFVLDGRASGAPALPPLAARVHEPRSGRIMTVHTTEPGMQLYSGNFLGDGLAGKEGAIYRPYAGFALETQHFPDSPNRPGFPSTLLRPGETFRSRTVYSFEVA